MIDILVVYSIVALIGYGLIRFGWGGGIIGVPFVFVGFALVVMAVVFGAGGLGLF